MTQGPQPTITFQAQTQGVGLDRPTGACPVCGMVDLVQKISATVAAGSGSQTTLLSVGGVGVTLDGSGPGLLVGGGGGTAQTTVTSDLAKMLEPPQEPELHGGWGCISIGLVLFFGLALLGLLGFNRDPAMPTPPGYEAPLCVVMIVLIIALKIWDGRSGRATYARRHAQWEQRLSEWQAAYYCHRDDTVFRPGDLGATWRPSGFAARMTNFDA